VSRFRGAALLAVALLAGTLAGCTAGTSGGGAAAPPADVASAATDLPPCPDQPDRPAAGEGLPRLALTCFSGGKLDLGRAPGVPTVINLWASWCGPCREELPLVQQLAASTGNRVRVLTVNSQDGVPQATSFAADSGVRLPTAFDGEGQLAAALGLRGLPQTLFVGADGSLAFVQVSAVHSLAEFESLVAEHLGVRL
jgi:cytochrome c biogenesis protein CcmG, thiol:disulfide interchange protein DsbE